MNEPKKNTEAGIKLIQRATAFALKRNGGKAGGWASKQQIDAMLYVAADELCQTEEEKTKMVDDWLSAPTGEATGFFSNASATAQYMEKNGVIEKRTSRVAKRENIFAGFTS